MAKRYGENARFWRQKFCGLLPEISRRELYKEKGFFSIYEFAAKLAGLSKDQVDIVLRLERKFEDKPILKSMLISGEASINKLARIASVATPENQEFWAEQIKILPKAAVETLLRDSHPKSLPGQTCRLDPELAQRLFELQQKGIDINKLLGEFLDKRELEIAQEKEELSEISANSRYIPVKIRRVLRKEHGSKCSIKTCHKPAVNIHHTQRFGLSNSHDPHYLAPLCKEHHIIAHSLDIKFQKCAVKKIVY